ncbi:2-amino-3,7-dideoxy-D-threo-hept-6-ulosonate synthase [Streptomyces sp. NRRL B-1347]|uniref:2-amino-3,7-dideoxy-D-threo-hept-6-ulosonate synthase n=1 Tax=Streptomyces sp. NRRL B-1347 TaxID=1476877 RepID=UPI003B64093E
MAVETSLDELVGELSANGVDGIVVHKGTARHLDPRWFAKTSLIVHLSASTAHAPDPDAKYLVASVEDALRLGADAVSVHVNVGSTTEREQVADLARVAEACGRWNVPLLAMMYARGPFVENPLDPVLLRHVATLAADLGADIVKVPHPGTEELMAELVGCCPIPVVVAGGPARSDTGELLEHVASTMRAGAAGVAMGRNVFQAPRPGVLARQIAARVHERPAIIPALSSTLSAG